MNNSFQERVTSTMPRIFFVIQRTGFRGKERLPSYQDGIAGRISNSMLRDNNVGWGLGMGYPIEIIDDFIGG